MIIHDLFETPQLCPECGGPAFSDLLLAEKKDACYHKVKASAKVWPSAYASGRLVQCRKKGAANYGNKSESVSKSDTGDTPIDSMSVQELAEYLGVSEQQVSRDVEHARDMSREKAQDLTEEFDIIERVVESLAEHNAVDAEAIWEDLESLTDDELYVFAVTMPLTEDWQKVNKRDKTDGMSRKAVNAYRRENPGSKLKTAVTTKPSKLKRGSKASKRRSSYCSRSRGQMKMHSISCAKTPDKAICKARRRWNCESIDFNLSEMDKTQTSPGRDGDIDWTKKQIHLGPEHVIKAKDVAKHALKALDKTMKKSHADTPKKKGVEEAFGPLPREKQQIRLGRHTVDIERVGLDKNYISFAWHDSQGQEHYEEVAVGDLGSYDDLIDKIKQEISYQERQYTDQGVAEAINPDITNPAFSHEQQIGDYLYVARYWSKGLKITAYHGNKQIGYAELMYHSAPFDDFADPKTTPKRIWLESEWTRVDPKYQRQGIMSTMYAYAKMLGNSVKPSQTRSDDAKAAWKSWRDAGDAQHLTREGVAEDQLDEINWKKAAATGALALGALGGLGASGSAQARVTPGADGQMSPSAAHQMAQQGFQASAEKPGGQMPNQNLDSAEKVERGDNGIIVHYGGKEYKGVLVPKDGPTPRGAKMIRIAQAQMGERGIGNYTTFLLPNGTAHIYKLASQNANEGVAEGDNEKIGGQYDPDDFDAMVQRLKKLAAAGPMKTVYDPQRRVYRNVPVAQQSKPQS